MYSMSPMESKISRAVPLPLQRLLTSSRPCHISCSISPRCFFTSLSPHRVSSELSPPFLHLCISSLLKTTSLPFIPLFYSSSSPTYLKSATKPHHIDSFLHLYRHPSSQQRMRQELRRVDNVLIRNDTIRYNTTRYHEQL
jgi:hypothetical protein